MTSIGAEDERLDAALAGWTASVRLPDGRATEMLALILATPAPELPRPRPAAPAGLPTSWWRDFSAGLAATLVSATAFPAARMA